MVIERKVEERQDEQIEYQDREETNDEYVYTLEDKIRDELKKDEQVLNSN